MITGAIKNKVDNFLIKDKRHFRLLGPRRLPYGSGRNER